MTTITAEQRSALTEEYVQYMLQVQQDWPEEEQDSPEQLDVSINHYHQNHNYPRFNDEQFLQMLKEFGRPVYDKFFA